MHVTGDEEAVVAPGKAEAGMPMHGFTANYIRVETEAHPDWDNRLVRVRLGDFNEDGTALKLRFKMHSKLVVVILNWNGKEMMRRFLPSVVRYSRLEGVEVIVADNHSTDGSVEMLREEFSSVGLVLLDRNYGFADGYNRALRELDAEYYLLLNSDVEVTPRWLDPLLAYMDTHLEMAACQPKLLSYHPKSRDGNV